ncbi:DUF885 family protein [Glycomyces rhizosphaerae]|uniref:DUF885 family protein n=1 Tax=Glycomyces rhizosphaerae TaxID=2054422 RepID=A0ABV7PXL9_9ACTN
MSVPEYRALLIGNSDFPEDPAHLLPLGPAPANDLNLLRSALIDDHIGLFDRRQVTLLPEGSRREMGIAVHEFFSAARPGDVLLLYYSGHGVLDIDDNLYLCAKDSVARLQHATALSSSEISTAIYRSPATTVIIVLDCCYAGSFKSGGLPTGQLQGTGRFVLSSCRASQLSMAGASSSLFTAALVEGLYRASPNTQLRLSDLYLHVHEVMAAGGSGQVPKFDFKGEGDVVIARRVIRQPQARDRGDDRSPDIDIRSFDAIPGLSVPTRFRQGGMRRIDWIADRYVEDTIALSPLTATAMGLPGHDHELDDLSPAGFASQASLDRHAVADLESTDPVDERERIAKDSMLERLRLRVERYDSGDTYMDLNVLASSVHSIRQIFDLMPRDGREAAENIASRLDAVPTAIEQYTETLRAEAAEGRVAAKRQVLEVATHCDNWNGAKGIETGFWANLVNSVTMDGEPIKTGPLHVALSLASNRARTAMGTFAAFLRDELAPQAPSNDAIGLKRYARASRFFIGAEIDLEATYAWAWKELVKIKADMASTAARIHPGKTIAQTMQLLDIDPDQNITDKDVFLGWIQELTDQTLADLADSHFDIPEPLRRVDCKIAPSDGGETYYTGPSEDFQRPGAMWWSIPPGQHLFSKWREKTTIFLLGVPGHHLQTGQTIARAHLLNRYQRQMMWCSGHGSGWARYCERLMEELGYYERDPAGKLGMLDNHAFQAARVIADIGLHCEFTIPEANPFGWRPGQQWDGGKMFEFIRMNTNTVADDILGFEVNRYLGWPGQAPCYKVGERLWMRLREECAARKGGDFSLKDFHTHALNLGPMGMGPLADAMKRY